MNVWKAASRWSETGTRESSIIDIFRRNSVVFVGKDIHRFQQMVIGDLIAISDGRKVVAFGRVQTQPMPLPELKIDFPDEDLQRFDCEEWVWGCRVTFVDLKPQDYPHYRPSTFHGVRARAAEFQSLYERCIEEFDSHQEFEINARTCTLLQNAKEPTNILWGTGVLYRVPIYQRPFSWKEPEINRLVTSLLNAHLGENGRTPNEATFIGTMQISDKKIQDGLQGRYVHEVIDGQQRISTLLLLLKVLFDRHPTTRELLSIPLENLLETQVNSGTQQRYLGEALNCDANNSLDAAQNPYLEAIPTIRSLLEEVSTPDQDIANEEASSQPFNPIDFVQYLLSRVYFVVVETRASLSKTLQIFDTINTSGMDLTGGDLFKVRYFDFLKSKRNAGEEVFAAISQLYQKIDEKNREHGWQVCSIEDILSLARHILVIRHDFLKSLHFSLGPTLFFERFFDTFFCIGSWIEFNRKKCQSIDLDICELNRLIELRFAWEKQIDNLPTEERIFLEFIWFSRYGRYIFVLWIFQDRFGADPVLNGRFIRLLSKLFLAFSTLYWRRVIEVDHLMNEILAMIAEPKKQAPAKAIFVKLETVLRALAPRLEKSLNNDGIAGNAKTKGIVCRLSAFLEERPFDETSSIELRKLIFETRIDIEHIQSYNHDDPETHERIHAEWKGELNRIGNLIVLEASKNRSIKNGDYVERKLPTYKDSAFRIVTKHSKDFPAWDLPRCEKRKKLEIEKLITYLCGAMPS